MADFSLYLVSDPIDNKECLEFIKDSDHITDLVNYVMDISSYNHTFKILDRYNNIVETVIFGINLI